MLPTTRPWSDAKRRKANEAIDIISIVPRITGQPIYYEDLAEALGNDFPANMGRVLRDVKALCDLMGWPRLPSLVVSKVTGECSSGYFKDYGEDARPAGDRVIALAWLKSRSPYLLAAV